MPRNLRFIQRAVQAEGKARVQQRVQCIGGAGMPGVIPAVVFKPVTLPAAAGAQLWRAQQ